MLLTLSSSSILPSSHVQHLKLNDLIFQRNPLPNPTCTFFRHNIPKKFFSAIKNIPIIVKNKPPSTLKLIARECISSNAELFGEESKVTDDWRDQDLEEIDDIGSPWEGAVMYQRNPSISHVEYCTTLERLGLGILSTQVSKSRASLMGLRVSKAVKDFPLGTPVLISVDVTRKKQKLRLDGIIRTVITLGCNRCGEPAAECIYSNFTLLLTEERMEEPEIINMGVIFGEDKFRAFGSSKDEEEDDEDSVDSDDRLYFPPEAKTIDISKNIRDLVHLEITINALCDPACKGLCLKCGANFNSSSCNCSKKKVKEKNYGPLGGLRKQMEQK
ncbi:unnamed protein product [Ilex paraguariensis]|uniref:Large ribosomal RNA subunit accumulation protein YCED homolog 1, chloroplastic n=1 Tax=Ilex paraguariensis TaxID=185542 RepID=A0ABC8RDG8_9AQUA